MRKLLTKFGTLAFLVPTMLVCSSCSKSDSEPDPTLSVDEYMVSFDANGGSKSLSITSNTNWTVSNSNDWITVNPTSGKGNLSVSLTASNNSSTEKRTGVIVIRTNDGTLSQRIDVEQAKVNVTLSLSGLDAPFDANASAQNEAQELSITCNTKWTISGKTDWLNISALDGTGNAVIKVWPNSVNGSTSERRATITVHAGDVSSEKSVVQLAGLNKNLYVVPNTIVTLATGIAFDYNYGKDVAYYYVKLYSPTVLERLTDVEVIEDMSSDINNRDTPSDGYVTSWRNLSQSTNYVVCCLGYDKNGKYGELQKTKITTKSGVNQALASISDVKYNEQYWQWTTSINGFVTRYYQWFNTNTYLYDTTEAAIAWFFSDMMKKYPDDFPAIAQGDVWTRNRNGGTVFDVITWAVNVEGELSGVIDRFQGSVSSSRSKLSPYIFESGDTFKRYKTQKPE